MNALAKLIETFERAGLVPPPVPAALEPALRSCGPWVFATREVDPKAMYLFFPYLIEAISEPMEDYIAISHAGHGVNSWAINYQLVWGPIAIFAQTGWGGVYMDAANSAGDVARQFRHCAELIALVEQSPHRGSLCSARLIIADSALRGESVCAWLDEPLENEPAAHQWLQSAREHSGSVSSNSEGGNRKPFRAFEAAIDLLRQVG